MARSLDSKNNLIIVAEPGDEIKYFGGLILKEVTHKWDIILITLDPVFEESSETLKRSFVCACSKLGVSNIQILGWPKMPYELCPIDELNIYLSDKKLYDEVYTYNLHDVSKLRQQISVVASTVYKKLYVTAMGGRSQKLIRLTKDEFEKKVNIINEYYSFRIARRKIEANDLRDIEAYQLIQANDLFMYYYENYHMPVYDQIDQNGNLASIPKSSKFYIRHLNSIGHNNPWNLKTSKYEQERYRMELEILRKIKFEKLIEIGACEGTFTTQLIHEYRDCEIVAYEPNLSYYRNLKLLLGKYIRIENKSIQQLDEECDVLFVSSLLYYSLPFPFNIFEKKIKYILLSHHKVYHEDIVDGIMRHNGYEVFAESNIGGKIEQMWNILDTKEGVNVKLWINSQK